MVTDPENPFGDLTREEELRITEILKGLPKVQYTARDVTSGIMFLGFADEKSLTYAPLFAEYLNCRLQRSDANLSATVRQTDNGSEYVGNWQAKDSSPYTKAVESAAG